MFIPNCLYSSLSICTVAVCLYLCLSGYSSFDTVHSSLSVYTHPCLSYSHPYLPILIPVYVHSSLSVCTLPFFVCILPCLSVVILIGSYLSLSAYTHPCLSTIVHVCLHSSLSVYSYIPWLNIFVSVYIYLSIFVCSHPCLLILIAVYLYLPSLCAYNHHSLSKVIPVCLYSLLLNLVIRIILLCGSTVHLAGMKEAGLLLLTRFHEASLY